MRASLLFYAASALLIAAAAANAQVRPIYPGAPGSGRPVAGPRDHGERPPRITRERPGTRPERPRIWYPGDWNHGHRHQGHGHHGHGHGHWGRIPWWYWNRYYGSIYIPYPNPHPPRPGLPRPVLPRPVPSRPVRPIGHPRPSWMNDASYRGANNDEPQQPQVIYPTIATPPSSGTDTYADNTPSYLADPYASDPYAYGEDPYASELESEHVCSRYYESEPVQYSYTPADAPQRVAVVRPERATLVSLILPTAARMPMHHLTGGVSPPYQLDKYAF